MLSCIEGTLRVYNSTPIRPVHTRGHTFFTSNPPQKYCFVEYFPTRQSHEKVLQSKHTNDVLTMLAMKFA